MLDIGERNCREDLTRRAEMFDALVRSILYGAKIGEWKSKRVWSDCKGDIINGYWR